MPSSFVVCWSLHLSQETLRDHWVDNDKISDDDVRTVEQIALFLLAIYNYINFIVIDEQTSVLNKNEVSLAHLFNFPYVLYELFYIKKQFYDFLTK